MTDSTEAPYQVVCVCGGHGYPRGTATAARITMIGRALLDSGLSFRLLHCGPSPVTINTEASGVFEGIPFEYMTGLRRPHNRFLRMLVYARAGANLTRRLLALWPCRRSTALYLYVMDSLLAVYVGLLCRLLQIPVVQEMCEWMPGDPRCSRLVHWLHKRVLFRQATGVITISQAITGRVKRNSSGNRRALLVQKVPTLVDTERFPPPAPANRSGSHIPEFVYCGTWRQDIFQIVSAFARVKQHGHSCRLRIIGARAEQLRPSLDVHIKTNGLSGDDIILAGCVDQSTLESAYRSAAGLLMPLWNDDRSLTRLPNKMSEYLASGRPVISSCIGDIQEFLTDGVSAYLATPGDTASFASKMVAVLENPADADRIGAAGREVCMSKLDYRWYSQALGQFFRACVETGGRLTDMSENSIFSLSARVRLQNAIRNAFCGTLALSFFALGRVSRAKKHILARNVVTSIYFHNPNKRLFTKCVLWLKKNGYTFVSQADVVEILQGRRIAPRGAAWLTFDDGFRRLLDAVVPVAREHHVPVTFFIPSGIIEGDGRFPWLASGRGKSPARHAMTLSELKEIARYPEITIGSHTVNHTITAGLPYLQVRAELETSKAQLEQWTGKAVSSFAYPVGQTDGREIPLLKELGYSLAVTTEPVLLNAQSNPYLLPRFHVGDEIPFAEAVCNIVGVWGPLRRILHFRFSTERPLAVRVE